MHAVERERETHGQCVFAFGVHILGKWELGQHS